MVASFESIFCPTAHILTGQFIYIYCAPSFAYAIDSWVASCQRDLIGYPSKATATCQSYSLPPGDYYHYRMTLTDEPANPPQRQITCSLPCQSTCPKSYTPSKFDLGCELGYRDLPTRDLKRVNRFCECQHPPKRTAIFNGVQTCEIFKVSIK
jgi:hypothetical protein